MVSREAAFTKWHVGRLAHEWSYAQTIPDWKSHKSAESQQPHAVVVLVLLISAFFKYFTVCIQQITLNQWQDHKGKGLMLVTSPSGCCSSWCLSLCSGEFHQCPVAFRGGAGSGGGATAFEDPFLVPYEWDFAKGLPGEGIWGFRSGMSPYLDIISLYELLVAILDWIRN